MSSKCCVKFFCRLECARLVDFCFFGRTEKVPETLAKL